MPQDTVYSLVHDRLKPSVLYSMTWRVRDELQNRSLPGDSCKRIEGDLSSERATASAVRALLGAFDAAVLKPNGRKVLDTLKARVGPGEEEVPPSLGALMRPGDNASLVMLLDMVCSYAHRRAAAGWKTGRTAHGAGGGGRPAAAMDRLEQLDRALPGGMPKAWPSEGIDSHGESPGAHGWRRGSDGRWHTAVRLACCGAEAAWSYARVPSQGWAAKTRQMASHQCPACFHKAEAELAARRNAQEGLPPLRGSPRQIQWAEQLRDRALALPSNDIPAGVVARAVMHAVQAHADRIVEETEQAVAGVRANVDSGWWIGNKDALGRLAEDALQRTVLRAVSGQIELAFRNVRVLSEAASSHPGLQPDFDVYDPAGSTTLQDAETVEDAGTVRQDASNVLPFRPRERHTRT